MGLARLTAKKMISTRLIAIATVFVGLLHPSLLAFELKREEFNGKKYVVAWVDLSTDNLALFYSRPDGKPLRTFTALNETVQHQGKRLVFAMNAGMYDLEYKPVGLCICNGAEQKAINLGEGKGNFYLKPNGVFYVDEAGGHVCKGEEYVSSPKIRLGTQSGPMLLMAGKPHAQFNPQSPNRLIRNAVGVKDSNHVALVISESEVTFYELAMLFKERLGCADALFLDGLISKAYAPPLVPTDTGSDFGPMLAVIKERP